MTSNTEMGVIGLGTIGGNLSKQAVKNGIRIVGKKHSRDKPELREKGVELVEEYDAFVNELAQPRVIYVSVPAGDIVDAVPDELGPRLDDGDVVMDGGNSFFRDSIRRAAELDGQGIHFLDCGTSGGSEGARHGACFMVGGDKEGVEIAEPILEELSVDGGYVHTGASGSGHFVKLVHNGIEFGMLQAIGEGVELLEDSDFEIELDEVFHNWSNGSVIRGWLVELMEQQLREQEFKDIPNYVEDTGEVNWLVQEAIKSETPIPVISQSVMELFKSREGQDNAYRAIALMRHGFGDHPFGSDESIAEERRTSRVENRSRMQLEEEVDDGNTR
ncbi:phosphogluconate dehydrogenase (NAD(+)-dependent, decarboxylating) [Natrinema sp. 1APR25-10V2]|uniref:phosphogluconate dehydrogenase (NAD(+)-dependent, decarboxylating) n=1 Tax=Natrinema sp. 1APR25-10V2 TaxID=2951081 RepID=UPI0028746947|nr:decarboxylating 6-phosphogluconate dehydrogenase [Natrinema sp. 1APR25-10V2]MDS0474610.1 decarboxylating 6-phosphogluconate dehydrogenase [Natrinema sp. 1APR25-10V2]